MKTRKNMSFTEPCLTSRVTFLRLQWLVLACLWRSWGLWKGRVRVLMSSLLPKKSTEWMTWVRRPTAITEEILRGNIDYHSRAVALVSWKQEERPGPPLHITWPVYVLLTLQIWSQALCWTGRWWWRGFLRRLATTWSWAAPSPSESRCSRPVGSFRSMRTSSVSSSKPPAVVTLLLLE